MDYSRAVDDILTSVKKPEDDFYIILGCDENSSEEQIVTEYKARVLSCHPDKHPNDSEAHEKFAKLSKAKDTLLDSEKRKDYDKWRCSGIAVPYDAWRSMAHIKTSMHWGVHKPQTALNHPSNNPQASDTSRVYMATQEKESENHVQLKEQMKFTYRENQNSPSRFKGWERDTSNPMLEKFRNYQI